MAYQIIPPRIPKAPQSARSSTNCPLCGGTGGYLELRQNPELGPAKESEHWVQCTCVKRRLAQGRMGHLYDELCNGPTEPLFGPGVDFTTQNCWITAPSDWIRPRLIRLIFLHLMRNQTWTYMIASDLDVKERIFDKNKISSELIQPGFLAFNLGRSASAHKLVGPTILEVVTARLEKNRPTWIIHEPDQPYGPKHFAWNSDLDDIMGSQFTRIME